MPRENATCSTCPFFNAPSECRRNPPVGLPQPVQNPLSGQVEINIGGFYPPTRATGWCGEHPEIKARGAVVTLQS